MSKRSFTPDYTSPNIVIVPTVPFQSGQAKVPSNPAKKIKLDNIPLLGHPPLPPNINNVRLEDIPVPPPPIPHETAGKLDIPMNQSASLLPQYNFAIQKSEPQQSAVSMNAVSCARPTKEPSEISSVQGTSLGKKTPTKETSWASNYLKSIGQIYKKSIKLNLSASRIKALEEKAATSTKNKQDNGSMNNEIELNQNSENNDIEDQNNKNQLNTNENVYPSKCVNQIQSSASINEYNIVAQQGLINNNLLTSFNNPIVIENTLPLLNANTIPLNVNTLQEPYTSDWTRISELGRKAYEIANDKKYLAEIENFLTKIKMKNYIEKTRSEKKIKMKTSMKRKQTEVNYKVSTLQKESVGSSAKYDARNKYHKNDLHYSKSPTFDSDVHINKYSESKNDKSKEKNTTNENEKWDSFINTVLKQRYHDDVETNDYKLKSEGHTHERNQSNLRKQKTKYDSKTHLNSSTCRSKTPTPEKDVKNKRNNTKANKIDKSGSQSLKTKKSVKNEKVKPRSHTPTTFVSEKNVKTKKPRSLTPKRLISEKSVNSETEKPRASTPKRPVSEGSVKKKTPTTLKSVVSVKTKSTSPSPTNSRIDEKENDTFDLRSKLTRKSLSHYFSRIHNIQSLRQKSSPRDNLIISVSNDQTSEISKCDAGKPENLEANCEPTNNKKKGKKFKLVIRLVCESSSSESENSDGKDEQTLTKEDLSFLDDLNIDEIVNSLREEENENNVRNKLLEIVTITSDDDSDASTVCLEEFDTKSHSKQVIKTEKYENSNIMDQSIMNKELLVNQDVQTHLISKENVKQEIREDYKKPISLAVPVQNAKNEKEQSNSIKMPADQIKREPADLKLKEHNKPSNNVIIQDPVAVWVEQTTKIMENMSQSNSHDLSITHSHPDHNLHIEKPAKIKTEAIEISELPNKVLAPMKSHIEKNAEVCYLDRTADTDTNKQQSFQDIKKEIRLFAVADVSASKNTNTTKSQRSDLISHGNKAQSELFDIGSYDRRTADDKTHRNCQNTVSVLNKKDVIDATGGGKTKGIKKEAEVNDIEMSIVPHTTEIYDLTNDEMHDTSLAGNESKPEIFSKNISKNTRSEEHAKDIIKAIDTHIKNETDDDDIKMIVVPGSGEIIKAIDKQSNGAKEDDDMEITILVPEVYVHDLTKDETHATTTAANKNILEVFNSYVDELACKVKDINTSSKGTTSKSTSLGSSTPNESSKATTSKFTSLDSSTPNKSSKPTTSKSTSIDSSTPNQSSKPTTSKSTSLDSSTPNKSSVGTQSSSLDSSNSNQSSKGNTSKFTSLESSTPNQSSMRTKSTSLDTSNSNKSSKETTLKYVYPDSTLNKPSKGTSSKSASFDSSITNQSSKVTTSKSATIDASSKSALIEASTPTVQSRPDDPSLDSTGKKLNTALSKPVLPDIDKSKFALPGTSTPTKVESKVELLEPSTSGQIAIITPTTPVISKSCTTALNNSTPTSKPKKSPVKSPDSDKSRSHSPIKYIADTAVSNKEKSERITPLFTPHEEKLITYLQKQMLHHFRDHYYVNKILKKGKYNMIFHCKNSKDHSYVLKRHRFTEIKMLKSVQKDIPLVNLTLLRILNVFMACGEWYTLLEYYPKNLEEAILDKNKPFHIDEVQNLARQLVAAVTVLRHNNIIHSDIKPAHILLDSSNRQLKLCGLGNASYVGQRALTPHIGTVYYRAPEIILGFNAGYPMDVWATGLVMYEMATNRKLFPGFHNNTVLFQQMCTISYIPTDMIQHGVFAWKHFSGTSFLKRSGKNGKDVTIKPENTFYKNNLVEYTLHKSLKSLWTGKENSEQRHNDFKKMELFYHLLSNMLTIHPKNRLPIEFVYSTPFLFDS